MYLNSPTARVALVQGTMATMFDLSPQEAGERMEKGWKQYRNLTAQVRRENPDLALVVWPESMFPAHDVMDADDQRQQMSTADRAAANQPTLGDFALSAQGIDPLLEQDSTNYFLAGGHSMKRGDDGALHYNTALLFDPTGNIACRYHKMHRAPFGEYIMFAEFFPLDLSAHADSRRFDGGPAARSFYGGRFAIRPQYLF